ncbi:MAG TPA: ABC transporter permease, partial [Gemmatimonadales bacterium]
MSKLFAIIRREFIERVRTKAFLIGTIMGPLMFFVIGQLPRFMFGKPSGSQVISVVDATAGHAGVRLLEGLRTERLGEGETGPMRYQLTTIETTAERGPGIVDSLIPLVDQRDDRGNQLPGAMTGILFISDSGLAQGRMTYLGSNVSSLGDMEQLEKRLRTAIVRERMHQLGLGDEMATTVTAPVELTTAKVSKGRLSGEAAETAFMLSYALVLILFLAMMPTGIQVMSAVVEEKSNRILEVLVSSVRPFHLMFGKI